MRRSNSAIEDEISWEKIEELLINWHRQDYQIRQLLKLIPLPLKTLIKALPRASWPQRSKFTYPRPIASLRNLLWSTVASRVLLIIGQEPLKYRFNSAPKFKSIKPTSRDWKQTLSLVSALRCNASSKRCENKSSKLLRTDFKVVALFATGCLCRSLMTFQGWIYRLKLNLPADSHQNLCFLSAAARTTMIDNETERVLRRAKCWKCQKHEV